MIKRSREFAKHAPEGFDRWGWVLLCWTLIIAMRVAQWVLEAKGEEDARQ